MGELFVVATPIGNLEDISFRAIRILKEVDLIAAEDTRHTLKLLNYYEISKPMLSYHRHNEDIKTDILINKLLEGKKIALVSDAGTPGISDPGEAIIKECISKGIKVTSIPGACAMINALICSGINTKEFCFIGFLPLNKKNRKQKLEYISQENKTLIMYEAPHKLKTTIMDLEKILGKRQIVLARELTKIHEEFIRGTANEIIEKIEMLKGEFVIIIEGCEIKEEDNKLIELSLEEHFKYYEREGLDKKEIIKKIAKDRSVSKNEIYKKFI